MCALFTTIKEHLNWYKVSKGLEVTSKALQDVVKTDILNLHRNIKNKVGHNVCTSQCNSKYHPGLWCIFCKQWQTELISNFRYQKKIKSIPWKDTSPEQWPDQPWEMAKVFTHTLLHSGASVDSETDLDITALASIISNCKGVTGLSLQTVSQVREARNNIGHIPTLGVSDSRTKDAFQCMRKLLKEPTIACTPNGKTALRWITFWEQIFVIILIGIVCALVLYVLLIKYPWIVPSLQFVFCKMTRFSFTRCSYEDTSCLQLLPKELFFSSLLNGHQGLVRRQWLLDEISEAITNSKGVVIQGPLATGKTTLAVSIICSSNKRDNKSLPQVLAYHFCQFDYKHTQDPVKFIKNIADMIASRLDEYESFIIEHENVQAYFDERTCREDIKYCFEKVILDPLNSIGHLSTQYLLVLDGLDECSIFGKYENKFTNEIANVVKESLSYFPIWLKVLTTTRNVHEDIVPRYPLKYITLNPNDPRHLSDIKLATEIFFSRKNISHENKTILENYVTSESQGNFLFAKMLQNEYGDGRENLDGNSLDNVFLRSFERSWGKNGKHYSVAKSVFEVMLASESPLDNRELSRILYQEETSSYIDIRNMSLLISQDEFGKFRFVHLSLAQWLTATTSWARVNKKEGHRKLAVVLLHQLTENALNVDFFQLLTHLVEADDPILRKDYDLLPRNKIQMAIKARHDLWKERNRKIIELYLYHWFNDISIKQAIFWSIIAGNPSNMIAFLNYDPMKASLYIYSKDHLLPFHRYGSLLELASHFNQWSTYNVLRTVTNAINFHSKSDNNMLIDNDTSTFAYKRFYNSYDFNESSKTIYFRGHPNCQLRERNQTNKDISKILDTQYDIYNAMDQPEVEVNLREQENLFHIALAMGNQLLINVTLQHRPSWIETLNVDILLNITSQKMPPNANRTQTYLDSKSLNLASLYNSTNMVWNIISEKSVSDPWVYCYVQKDDFENKNKIQRCSSPLHLAVLKGHFEIVKVLVLYYPQLSNEKDISNMTPLELAIKMNHTDVAELLIDKSAKLLHTYKRKNLLHEAFIIGNARLINKLVERNNSLLYEKDDFNFLPVHYAVLHGNIPLLEVMSSKLTKEDGKILYIASFSGCYKTVEYLINKGFSNVWWNDTYEGGSIELNVSALHTAVVNNYTDIVRLILDYFPDVRHSEATLTFNTNIVKPWIVPTVTSMITDIITQVDDVIPFQMSYKDMASPWNVPVLGTQKAQETIVTNTLRSENKKLLQLKTDFSNAYPELVRKELNILGKIIWMPLEKGMRDLLREFNNKTDAAGLQKKHETYVQVNLLLTRYAITLKTRLHKVPLLMIKPHLFESLEYRKYKEASESLYQQLNRNILIRPLDMAALMNLTEIASLIQKHGVGRTNRSSDDRNNNGGFSFVSAVLAVENGNLEMLNHVPLTDHVTKLLSNLAAQKWDLDILKYLWNVSIDNRSAIMNLASAAGHMDIVQFLIDQGVLMKITCEGRFENYCTNALHEATLGQHSKIVTKLLKHFPQDINALSEPFGMTSLDLAVTMNYTEIATILIEKKANIKTQYHKHGIFYTVIQKGNLLLVRTLIQMYGCRLAHTSFHSNDSHWSPITIPAYYGNLEIFKEIDGCSDWHGCGCMFIYYDRPFVVALMNGNHQVLEFLMKKGRHHPNVTPLYFIDQQMSIPPSHFSDIHEALHYSAMLEEIKTIKTKIDKCSSPLCIASVKGYHEVVKVLLIDSEAEKYARQYLELFASMGYPEAVNTLINAGVDIDSKITDSYFLPFHLAAYYGHIDVLKVFSKYANLDDYHTLEAAVLNDQTHVIDYLVGIGVQNLAFENLTILAKAALKRKLPSIKSLLRHFPELLHSDSLSVLLAAREGHLDIIKECSKYMNLDDYHTLKEAVLHNQINIIDYLGHYGVRNHTDPVFENLTVLHYASIIGNLSCIKTLVRLFPKILNKQTPHLQTPSHTFTNVTAFQLVVFYQNIDAAHFLLHEGASIENDTLIELMSCAIAHDKLATVNFLLLIRPDVLSKFNEQGRLPQHDAAFYGRLGVLKEIYKLKDLDDGKTFQLACLTGHRDIVKYLISIHITKPWGCLHEMCQTGLHSAAKHGYKFLIKPILSHFGYIIDLKTAHYEEKIIGTYSQTEGKSSTKSLGKSIKRGSSALEIAIKHDHLGVLSSLLRHGAKKEVGYLTTQKLLYSGRETMRLYLLKKGGADILINGENTIYNPLHSVAFFGQVDILRQMSNYTDLDTGGPLHYACQGQSLKSVKYLVEHYGVKKTWWCKKANDCKTVLHTASYTFSTNAIPELEQIIRLLLKHFPNILNQRTKNVNDFSHHSETALEISLLHQNEIAAFVLLEIGAYIDCTNKNMIYQAIHIRNSTIVKMLLFNCPQLAKVYHLFHGFPTQMAASKGSIDILKELSHFTDLDNGVTLSTACRENQIAVVDFLLEFGIKNTTFCLDNFTFCTTAFYTAISQKNNVILKKLMSHFPDGYKITEKSKEGDHWEDSISVLGYAIARNMTEFVVDVLRANSTLTTKDCDQLMNLAIHYNNTVIVEAITREYFPSPLYLSHASSENKTEIVKALLNADAKKDSKVFYIDEGGINHKIIALCLGVINDNNDIVDAITNSGIPEKVNFQTAIIIFFHSIQTLDFKLLWCGLSLL